MSGIEYTDGYDAGYEATGFVNPHKIGSQEYVDWKKGYAEGRKQAILDDNLDQNFEDLLDYHEAKQNLNSENMKVNIVNWSQKWAEKLANREYDETIIESFGINVTQVKLINEWYIKLKAKIREQQKAVDPLHGDDPYYGAIGGGLTYQFTPTGLGTVLKVTEALTGETLDVTDYDSW